VEFLFTVFLGVGLGYSVISFLLGEALQGFDADLTAGGSASPLKPSVIAAFVTVFGGAGLLLSQVVPPLTAVPLAGVVAAGVAYAFFRFVVLPLSRAENTSAVAQHSLIGHPAKVSLKIPQGKYGKITYYVDGSTYSAPAKSEDGSEILRDTRVEIVYIEQNTYYVRRAKAEGEGTDGFKHGNSNDAEDFVV